MEQNKAGLEKAKQHLEAENVDMANEIKQLSTARQESERKRKQAETQLQDYVIRLTELERNKGEVGEKVSKLQVRT